MRWYDWKFWIFAYEKYSTGDGKRVKEESGEVWVNLWRGFYLSSIFFSWPWVKVIRGFSFFSKTNIRQSRCLFSYHHPDSITWLLSCWLYWDVKKSKWKVGFWRNTTQGTWKFSFLTPWFQFTFDKQYNLWRDEVPILLDKARRARRSQFVRKSWGKNFFQGKAKKEVDMSAVDKIIAAERVKFEQETGANVLEMKSKSIHH